MVKTVKDGGTTNGYMFTSEEDTNQHIEERVLEQNGVELARNTVGLRSGNLGQDVNMQRNEQQRNRRPPIYLKDYVTG